MRTNVCVALSMLALVLPSPTTAQADPLRVALAEGEIAALHAALAAEAAGSSNDVRLHVEHMLHALDPALVLEGPGLGYGFRRAAEEALEHIQAAAATEGASDNVRTHAFYIAAALRSALERADASAALARDIQLATSTAPSGAQLARLRELGGALVQGQDLDGDGLIGWRDGEGGIRQAVQHMTLLQRGEGLAGQP